MEKRGWTTRLSLIGGLLMLAIALPWSLWWFFNVPTPGMSGILLAVVATLLPLVWDDIHKVVRAGLVLTVIILFGVEYRAIHKEHVDYADEQRKARNEEQESFEKVLSEQEKDFLTLMQTSQANFKVVIEGEQTSFERMEKNSRKAQQKESGEFSDVLNREQALISSTGELFVSLNGQLLPGHEPTPKTMCGTPPAGSYIAVVDGGGFMFTRFPHVVLALRKQNAIWLDKKPDGSVALFMDVRDQDGRIVIRIDKDGFFVHPNAGLFARRPDKSAILIQDEKGEDMLTVRYLNPQAFQITEHFGNFIPSVGCINAMSSADILIN